MKKRIQGMIIGIVIGIMISGVVTLAKTGTEAINAWYSDIKICINGEYITPTDANGNEVEPFTVNGTTYLPVRAIGNALDMNVDWDNDTKTVFLSEKAIEIPKNPNSNPEIDKYIEETLNAGFDEVLKSYKEMGIDLVLYSEGDTLVYDCTIDVQVTDEEISDMKPNMEESLAPLESTMESIFIEAPEIHSVKVVYKDNTGKLILEKIFNR